MLFRIAVFLSILATVAVHVAAAAVPITFANETLSANSTGLEKRLFRYHDNFLRFRQDPNLLYKIEINEFIVKDFCITPGQDPQGLHKVGDVHTMERPTNNFRFKVGRHRSKKVAKWWQQHFRPLETTFQHHPEHLNFAFIGDLKGTILRNTEAVHFVIPDVGVAQGQVITSNNWWFAIKNPDAFAPDILYKELKDAKVKIMFGRGILATVGNTRQQNQHVNDVVMDLEF